MQYHKFQMKNLYYKSNRARQNAQNLMFRVFLLKGILSPFKGFSCNAVFPLCLPLKTLST